MKYYHCKDKQQEYWIKVEEKKSKATATEAIVLSSFHGGIPPGPRYTYSTDLDYPVHDRQLEAWKEIPEEQWEGILIAVEVL